MPRSDTHPSKVHLSWDPVKKDLLGLRSITWTGGVDNALGVSTVLNIPQELWLWDGVGMGWGRDPREATTLALAILDRHLGGGRTRVCDEWHRPLSCDPWAYRLSWAFAERVLLPQDYWCLRVDAWTVRRCYELLRQAWDAPAVDLSLITPAERWPLTGL